MKNYTLQSDLEKREIAGSSSTTFGFLRTILDKKESVLEDYS